MCIVILQKIIQIFSSSAYVHEQIIFFVVVREQIIPKNSSRFFDIHTNANMHLLVHTSFALQATIRPLFKHSWLEEACWHSQQRRAVKILHF